MKLRWSALIVFALLARGLAQAPASVTVNVSESGGMRRTQFPVTARVPLPRAALTDPANVRLLLGQTEVASQPAADARWPDGSIQWLAVDFNATIGPLESQAYTLQYGAGVKSDAAARGLAVAEDGDGIQVGNIRFNRSGLPLVASVKYRDEAIGTGPNGLSVVDTAGTSRDLSSADGLKTEIVKRGPLSVVIRYSGSIRLESGTAPFTLTTEMPNSKSWVKLSASVSDPSRRIREIVLATPLALGPLPWVWDFGTTRWTYGSMRNPADSVVMTHVRSASGAEWTVANGPKGREQTYETSRADRSAFAGWGHVQSGKEVVAFAIEGVPSRQGTYRVALSGDGQTTFGFAAASPQTSHELTVFQHYVSTPVQIGAATSPAAILSPLTAVCERDQYTRAGVPVPAGVR